jgi:hypothetical protein
MRKLSYGPYGYLHIEPVNISSFSEHKTQMADACYFVQLFEAHMFT